MLLRLSPSPANRPADFNPHSSCEERPDSDLALMRPTSFQSTPLMRGATLDPYLEQIAAEIFQSTLLIRGATRRRTLSRARQGHFNPRSSYEERLSIVIPAVLEIGISIHAPHTRSDLALASQPINLIFISIHAPHTRSDARQIRDEQSLSNFNPRSSYEERHDDPATGGNVLRDFNPRSSYEERRTRKQYRPFHCNFNPRSSYEERPPVADRCHTGYDSISIHAPHTRSDLMHGSRRRIWIYFNPRSSYEERLRRERLIFAHQNFNPRSSYEERPGRSSRRPRWPAYFNPRSSYEERRERGRA